MKKLLPLILATSVLLTIVAVYFILHKIPGNQAGPAHPIKIATGSWQPFVGPDLDGYGPVGRILTATLRRMNYEPVYYPLPWDLAVTQTKRSEYFGTFPFIKTAAREEDFLFSAPLAAFDHVLFYNRLLDLDVQSLKSIDDLANKGYKFGKIRGYKIWPPLNDTLIQFYEEYPTSLAAFRALSNGDIEFLQEGLLAGKAIIAGVDSEIDAHNIAHLGFQDGSPFGAEQGMHLMLPKSLASEAFIESFNINLDSVKSSFFYSEMLTEIEGEGIQKEEVILQAIPGESYIYVLEDTSSSAMSYYVPVGTRAVVLSWPPMFRERIHSYANEPLLSKVKLLNGPLHGRILFVDVRSVILVN